jgi:hypothetical protein
MEIDPMIDMGALSEDLVQCLGLRKILLPEGCHIISIKYLDEEIDFVKQDGQFYPEREIDAINLRKLLNRTKGN